MGVGGGVVAGVAGTVDMFAVEEPREGAMPTRVTGRSDSLIVGNRETSSTR
jgi:hypothetical protein